MKLFHSYSHKEVYLPVLGIPFVDYDYKVSYKKNGRKHSTNKSKKFTEAEFDEFVEFCRIIMFSENKKPKAIYYKLKNISPRFLEFIKDIPKCSVYFSLNIPPHRSYVRFYYRDSVFSVKNLSFVKTRTIPLGVSFLEGKEDDSVYDEIHENFILLKLTDMGKVLLSLGVYGIHQEQVGILSRKIVVN